MEKVVSAAEANRNFSRLLRTVREGAIYIVTSHGRPIAKIVPVDGDDNVSNKARSALLKRLRSQRVVAVGPWRRDELYKEPR
jgi:prevent-host-death family protein